MSGKLSFAVAINLITENFKHGANNVKSYLKSMQQQIIMFAAALGMGGIGLSNFFSRLIEVSRETSKAITLLKNVSSGTANFAENLKFLNGLASKYGIYINDLTSNYAKFTAAANISGMSLKSQQKLFESLSRASTAFGMSADDTNGMFLAITQMMGKGKIQAEELRGQLGERLPIAMQAMSKAAGVSISKLDSIMKKGKLLSAEVLPEFADALNEMMPNVNTDNIETSVSRLKNAFSEFTNSLGIGDKYKKIVDIATNELKRLQSGMSEVITFVVSLIAGKLSSVVFGYFSKLSSERKSMVKQAEIAETQVELATKRRIAAQEILEETQTQFNTVENGKRLATRKQVINAELALERAKASEKRAIEMATSTQEKAMLVSSSTRWGTFFKTIKLGISQVFTAFQGLLKSFSFMFIIAGITKVIQVFNLWRNEIKRIDSIYADFKERSANIGFGNHEQEVQKLRQLQRIITDTNGDLKTREASTKELNKMLNEDFSINSKTLKVNGDINEAIRKRIGLLKDAAKAEFYQNESLESEKRLSGLKKEFGAKVNQWNERNPNNKITGKEGSYDPYSLKSTFSNMTGVDQLILKSLNILNRNIAQEEKVHNEAQNKADKYVGAALSTEINTPIEPDEPDKSKKTELEKAEEEYTKSLTELKNQLDNGALKQAEYNKKLDDINKQTFEKLSGLLTPENAKTNKTYQEAKKGKENPLTSKTYDLEVEYQNEFNKLKNQKGNGTLNEKEFNEEWNKLIKSTLNTATSLDEIGLTGQAFVATLKFVQNQLKTKYVAPKEEKRDTTFDYKKTKTEIISEEKSYKEKYIDKLKSSYNGDSDKLIEDIKNAQGNLDTLKTKYGEEAAELINLLNNSLNDVKTLDEALNISKVKEDIKNLSKELDKGIYSGIKDIASSADRMVSAFESMKDVMSDVDASGWERVMAVWNFMTNTVDSFLSIIKMIENLTKITDKLSKAKEAEATIDTTTTAAKIANKTTETTAEVTAAATQTATDIAMSTAITTAAKTEMAAKSTAAFASIPYVGVALAASQIAGMNALIAAASIPGFATGGIIPGTSFSGDKVLARLNSGEMVLNQAQQSNLFKSLNSSDGTNKMIYISGKSYVRGDIIYTVLTNHLKKIGKKL